jgi:amino acid transporter
MFKKIKTILIGNSKDPKDKKIFHHLSLVAFLAWVGLGADGLSSSCYGPEEAFLTLKGHIYLGIFVAFASGLTIFIIAISYSQIIELFPNGGGGYLVASKLLSPVIGMISGSALLIDYVLTVAISISSGADAVFSFLPKSLYSFRIEFAVFGLLLLTILNLRGIKEAVIPLVPIFLLFVLLHLFAIFYSIFFHLDNIAEIYSHTASQISNSVNTIGIFGVIFIVLRAFTMGAGTFTGIEAVSNGLPILREPRQATGKKTMVFMAISLAVTVVGLMLAYLLFNVQFQEGKTLNAVLFEQMSAQWNPAISNIFIFTILLSEAILLFIAAQTGFLDGPRVLANMAADKWLPSRFAMISDRLVTENGILLIGFFSFFIMILTKGNVKVLVVLYSINVFITFSLSQLGMVKHWWLERKKQKIFGKILINGIGLTLTTFILFSVIIIKFQEGGWITIVLTGTLVIFSLKVKNHYKKTALLFKKLDSILDSVKASLYNTSIKNKDAVVEFNPNEKTAVLMVNGYNGLGFHTLLSTIKLFGKSFKNFVFIQVGAIDADNFKGVSEIKNLEKKIKRDTDNYIKFITQNGYYAEAFTSISIDVIEEIEKIAIEVKNKFPNSVFFAGQIVFGRETFANRLLHNQVALTVQRKLYHLGIPILILPIRLENEIKS